MPMTVTPLSVTIVSSGTVRSQLPPRSAARSTITEPGFIACDHVGRPQLRRRPARDQGGGDDDVDLRRELAELGELLLAERGARGRGIAAGGGTVLRLLEGEEDELRAHRLDLLGDFRPHVEGIGDGPQAGRRADRGEPGHAGSHHQHLGRRHLAGGGDLTGEEAAEMVAGLDHGAVTGDVGHRGERVHLLGARDARHHVHGHDGGTLFPAQLEEIRVLRRPEERDQRLTFRKPTGFTLLRRTNLGDYICCGPERSGGRHDLDAHRPIGSI